jgi:hypothetical protein
MMQNTSGGYRGFKTVMLPLNAAMREAAEVSTQYVQTHPRNLTPIQEPFTDPG